MDIIYLRVSKEDKDLQDPKQQLNAIITHFKINNYKVFEERGSAYNLDKLNKRTEFLEILDICFNINKTTFQDFFLNITELNNKERVNLYVWDYSRLIRNIKLNLLISILASFYNVKIYSYKDKAIIKETSEETPTSEMVKLMMNTISAFSAEEYSYTISTNTKKAIIKGSNNITHSTYGIAFGTFNASNNWQDYWSETITNSKGIQLSRLTKEGKLSMTYEEKEELIKYIKHLLRTSFKFKARIELIDELKKRKGICISEASLSRLSKAL